MVSRSRAKERASRLAALNATLANKFGTDDLGPFAPAGELPPEPTPAPSQAVVPDEIEPAPAIFAAEEAKIMDHAPPAPQPNLASLAFEINARLERANRLQDVSQEHRLAAALRMVEARKACEAAHIRWHTWSQAHIQQSKRNISVLIKIGSSPNPREALLAHRAANLRNTEAYYDRQREKLAQAKKLLAGPAAQAPQPEAPATAAEPAAAPSYRPVTVESLLADYAKLSVEEQREFLARVPHPNEEAA